MTLHALLFVTLLAQQPAGVRGDVVDPSGAPLPGAVVSLKGSISIAVTDEHGKFLLADAGSGATLVVSMSGFASKTVVVTATGAATPLHIALEIAATTDEISVRAPIVTTPPDARLPLRPLDVVRTAGTQADIMRALAVLPGVATIDDGAGLFVRGGDVSETRILLDGSVINHPYRYETPTGGFRGAIDPFLTQGLSFTTGGFSAEYGNSLSAVVDMQGLGRPAVPRVTATAGLAGVSGSLAQPLGKSGGVRFSANRTTPGLLFAVNPSPREFDQLPGGWDLNAGAYFESATQGTFRFFALEQKDHVGVELEKDAFVGFLHAGSTHRLLSGLWQRPLPRGWGLTAAIGTDSYVSTTDVGVFAVAQTDGERSARIDFGGRAGAWTLRLGADAGSSRTNVVGEVPAKGGDFGGVAGVKVFEVAHADWRSGVYGELTRTIGRLTPTVGVRSDFFDHAGVARVDPRVNVNIELTDTSRLRFAWGLYHQAPSPAYFDNVSGAASLSPMAATHYVAGYERGKIGDAEFFRAEAYVKAYRDLPLEDAVQGFTSAGYGHARGLDLFYRRVWHFIDVRATASISDAARRWTSAEQRDRFPLPAGTWRPDFSIPFTWQLVVNAPLSRTITLATTWHRASGRPFTPALGGIETAAGFEPVWGEINSERLPHYARVDLSVSWLRSFASGGSAIFFASVGNVSGRKNFFEYAYSADYATRHPVLSTSPRSFYVGCSVTR